MARTEYNVCCFAPHTCLPNHQSTTPHVLTALLPPPARPARPSSSAYSSSAPRPCRTPASRSRCPTSRPPACSWRPLQLLLEVHTPCALRCFAPPRWHVPWNTSVFTCIHSRAANSVEYGIQLATPVYSTCRPAVSRCLGLRFTLPPDRARPPRIRKSVKSSFSSVFRGVARRQDRVRILHTLPHVHGHMVDDLSYLGSPWVL